MWAAFFFYFRGKSIILCPKITAFFDIHKAFLIKNLTFGK